MNRSSVGARSRGRRRIARSSLLQREFLGRNRSSVSLDRVAIPVGTTQLSLQWSREMEDCSGFLRGLHGDPRYVRANGEVITDPRQMRMDCRGFLEHVEDAFEALRRPVLAAVSFGDLTTNGWYVAWVRTGGRARLICRHDERARMAAGAVYYALGVEADGAPWAGEIRFVPDPEQPRFVSAHGETLPDLSLVFTGPPVVWDGRPLAAVATAAYWNSDLRHLLTFPACRLPFGGQALLGEAELLQDPDLLAAAVRGEPVRVTIPPCDLAALRADSEARGYRVVETAGELRGPGDVAFAGDEVVLCYQPALYPHSVLGINATQDAWIHLQVGGVSTQSGCTVGELGRLLDEAGGRYGIGLDQGADPQRLFRRGGEMAFRPSFNYRARVSAALVWTEREPVPAAPPERGCPGRRGRRPAPDAGDRRLNCDRGRAPEPTPGRCGATRSPTAPSIARPVPASTPAGRHTGGPAPIRRPQFAPVRQPAERRRLNIRAEPRTRGTSPSQQRRSGGDRRG